MKAKGAAKVLESPGPGDTGWSVDSYKQLSREEERGRSKPFGNLIADSFLPVLSSDRFPLRSKSKPSITLHCTKNKNLYILHLGHWASRNRQSPQI